MEEWGGFKVFEIKQTTLCHKSLSLMTEKLRRKKWFEMKRYLFLFLIPYALFLVTTAQCLVRRAPMIALILLYESYLGLLWMLFPLRIKVNLTMMTNIFFSRESTGARSAQTTKSSSVKGWLYVTPRKCWDLANRNNIHWHLFHVRSLQNDRMHNKFSQEVNQFIKAFVSFGRLLTEAITQVKIFPLYLMVTSVQSMEE